jgi:hypothetical protein
MIAKNLFTSIIFRRLIIPLYFESLSLFISEPYGLLSDMIRLSIRNKKILYKAFWKSIEASLLWRIMITFLSPFKCSA